VSGANRETCGAGAWTLWPEKTTPADLASLKVTLGSYRYALQNAYVFTAFQKHAILSIPLPKQPNSTPAQLTKSASSTETLRRGTLKDPGR
jgi:hypothetical protein